tara:strand:+ start:964 stop:1227 length:264 start_codon:yes stop_codon:yes gene_type:complete
MLLYEFKQYHPNNSGESTLPRKETETRIYLDEETTDIIFYQYLFEGPKVLDISSVTIPIRQLANLSKMALTAYASIWINSYNISEGE